MMPKPMIPAATPAATPAPSPGCAWSTDVIATPVARASAYTGCVIFLSIDCFHFYPCERRTFPLEGIETIHTWKAEGHGHDF